MAANDPQILGQRDPATPADATITGTPRPGDRSAGVLSRLKLDPQWVVRRPGSAWNVLVLVALALVTGGLLRWSQPLAKIAPGQVMNDTALVRVPFAMVDGPSTESARQQARSRAPRVYLGDVAVFDAVRTSLENLPRALADVQSLAEVDEAIKAQFTLTPTRLEAVRRLADAGQPTAWWLERVKAVDAGFRAMPVVDTETFQREASAGNDRVELRLGDRSLVVPTGDVLNIESPQVGPELRSIGAVAGLEGELLGLVTDRLMKGLRPTYQFDEPLTAARQKAAADATPNRLNEFTAGQVILARGEVVTGNKLEILNAERAAFAARGERSVLAGEHLALWGTGALTALGLGAFTATFAPMIWRSPRRLAALALLVVLALGAAVWTAVVSPWLTAAALTLPALATAMVLVVAYDRPTGLAIGSLLGIVTCIALEQPVLSIGLALCGVWVGVWRVGDLRRRLRLVQAGAFTGLALALTAVVLAGMQRPLVPAAMSQTLWELLMVGGGALLVSFIVLGSLPAIERLFNVTTALTLIELRDPGHPLLRMLQQRAAGTYNHALNVAAISESAAEAIGADSLLTYVGALYHDVGKMAKPEYFVENQAGGPNKHDKLAPATSLLVIVGHVQEGLELARHQGLPRSLHHFIESHHGTTLVEYFFHRARKQAEAGGPLASGPTPQEIEYRYPGPKPRTREAAILMIADASESATRTIPDPSPPRIESLVRAIAHKRLMDGQFDHCDLTLREIASIVESISRSLAAIHHQRIAYPGGPVAKPAAPVAAAITPAPIAARV
jgi:cyclic-di-AMP phosphodiesterase PgpH